jgi:transcriptional regulator with XRE-family HTH domain
MVILTCLMAIEQNFGEWLRDELRRQSLSQKQLAERSRISPAHISRIISGGRGYTAAVCRAFAEVLHLSEDEVFRRAGLMEGAPGQYPPDATYLVNAMTADQLEEWIEYGRYILDRDERKKAK